MQEEIDCIVRIKTTTWFDKSGLHVRKDIRTMKRLSQGFDFFTDECQQIGAEDALSMLTNLDKCEDGLYHVVIINEQRDWESGHIDSYEFKLIPLEN